MLKRMCTAVDSFAQCRTEEVFVASYVLTKPLTTWIEGNMSILRKLTYLQRLADIH